MEGAFLSAEETIKEGFTEQKVLEQDPRDMGLEFFSAMMVRVGKDSTGRGIANNQGDGQEPFCWKPTTCYFK